MGYRKYTAEERQSVIDLFEKGEGESSISRLLGINRDTLKAWIKKHISGESLEKKDTVILDNPDTRRAYSYILAIYLCDGWICQSKKHRANRLVLSNDSKYEKNTKEWADNLQIIFPNNSVNIKKHKTANCVSISLYSTHLRSLFPQIGLGKKHLRKLVFEDWQMEIVKEFPREFIRGCIQSDGCVYEQKVGNSIYKKHAFSNMSEDIIDLLLYALSLVGIKKEKWSRKSGDFVIQNFKKDQELILHSIIPNKE